jgi:hypothetical protein
MARQSSAEKVAEHEAERARIGTTVGWHGTAPDPGDAARTAVAERIAYEQANREAFNEAFEAGTADQLPAYEQRDERLCLGCGVRRPSDQDRLPWRPYQVEWPRDDDAALVTAFRTEHHGDCPVLAQMLHEHLAAWWRR